MADKYPTEGVTISDNHNNRHNWEFTGRIQVPSKDAEKKEVKLLEVWSLKMNCYQLHREREGHQISKAQCRRSNWLC